MMKSYHYKVESGEYVIEWVAEDARFSLWFDAEGTSSWSFVTKDGTMESGDMDISLLNALAYGVGLTGLVAPPAERLEEK